MSEFSHIKCPNCSNGLLERSGVEVHRYVCVNCKQHFHAVLRFEPAPPLRILALPNGPDSSETPEASKHSTGKGTEG